MEHLPQRASHPIKHLNSEWFTPQVFGQGVINQMIQISNFQNDKISKNGKVFMTKIGSSVSNLNVRAHGAVV